MLDNKLKVYDCCKHTECSLQLDNNGMGKADVRQCWGVEGSQINQQRESAINKTKVCGGWFVWKIK